jgi:ATP-dependent helicase/nuclease subunit A
MVNTLKQYNIPVAGADRMILTEQLAVMDLLALGRFVLLPEDDLTLAVVLKGPMFGFTDNDDLFPLAYQRTGTLWGALKKACGDNAKYREAYKRLKELRARADYMPPYEFYAQLLGAEGVRKDLLSRLGQEAEDPIDEFLSLTIDFEREHVPSLQGFLSWVESGRTQIKRDMEQGRGEVRVMTIHGSKGLQGNIVFLPDTCSVPTSRHETKLRWIKAPEPALLWGPAKDQEESRTAALTEKNKQARTQEYRRLLYVALTRARDRLYIGGWEGKSVPSDDCWYKLIEPAFKEISNEVLTETGERVHRLSNPQEKSPDGKDVSSNSEITNMPSIPDWALSSAPPEPISTMPITPSQLLEVEPAVRSPFNHKDGSHFIRGTLIHRLLESLPNLAPEKRAKAIFGYLARPIHGLDKNQRNAIAEEVLSVMEDPKFKPLFGPGSFSEVPINGLINGCVVSGRIDRIAISDKQIIIVDYKTNRPAPQLATSVSPIYIGQMATYRTLLREVYPGRKIICILAWTDSICLMTLPDELLDQYAS